MNYIYLFLREKPDISELCCLHLKRIYVHIIINIVSISANRSQTKDIFKKDTDGSAISWKLNPSKITSIFGKIDQFSGVESTVDARINEYNRTLKHNSTSNAQRTHQDSPNSDQHYVFLADVIKVGTSDH